MSQIITNYNRLEQTRATPKKFKLNKTKYVYSQLNFHPDTGCKAKLGVEVGVNVNQGTCFADVDDNVNDKLIDSVNDNVNDNVHDGKAWSKTRNVNGNDNDNATDTFNGFHPQPTVDDNVNQGTCFADDKAMLMTMLRGFTHSLWLRSRLMVNKNLPYQMMMMTQCGRKLVNGTKSMVGVTTLALPQPNKEIYPVHNFTTIFCIS